MVYRSISRDNFRINNDSYRLKNRFFFKNKGFLLIFLSFLLLIIFNSHDYKKIAGKDVLVGEKSEEFVGERCTDWGKCTVDYNFKDISNSDGSLLGVELGVERRECLESRKLIVQRRICDPTISVKTKITDKGLEIIGKAPSVKASLPSLKLTEKGVEVFEPAPELEKEVLVSIVKLSEEKGVRKLDIDIIL